MPSLGALIASLFGGIASLIGLFWAKKISVTVIAVAAFAAALAVLMALFNGLVSPLLQTMFSTSLGQFIGLAFPPIAGTCLASISACWCGCALYKLKVQAIKMTASA